MSVAKKFKERNITCRYASDGSASYTVQIRRRRDGNECNLARTFKHLKAAKKWRDTKLAEIELNGIPSQVAESATIADVIAERLNRGKELGKSACQNLKFIRDHDFGATEVSKLTQNDFFDFADDLSSADRTPQTVAGYMTHLAAALRWAQRRGTVIPVEIVTIAMETLWEDEILARSEERARRPLLTELDAILTAISKNKRQTIPVAILVVFALYSARRLGEICRLRWEDLREIDSKIMVRDMKHPRKKKGNDVWCKLPPEALAIIKAMPRTSDFIFPYCPKSVGTAYRRHRDKVGVTDLRFHDFRHEAISRHFEIGQTAPFVSKISGHKNGGCLYRYEHVEEAGDKFANWKWFDHVIDMCGALRMEHPTTT